MYVCLYMKKLFPLIAIYSDGATSLSVQTCTQTTHISGHSLRCTYQLLQKLNANLRQKIRPANKLWRHVGKKVNIPSTSIPHWLETMKLIFMVANMFLGLYHNIIFLAMGDTDDEEEAAPAVEVINNEVRLFIFIFLPMVIDGYRFCCTLFYANTLL